MASSRAPRLRLRWLMLACVGVSGVLVAAATAGAPVGTATANLATGRLVPRLAVSHPHALSGFDCRTVTHCVAVGASDPSTATRLVGEDWSGARWRVTAAMLTIAGARNVAAGGVACPASHQCVAVGVGYPRGGSGYFAIAAYWNGSHWTTARAAAAGSSSVLAAVSCPQLTSCYAVGHYTPRGSVAFAPLIEHWDGTKWSQARAPVPRGSRYGNLADVSCATARFCAAVGTDGAAALIERWDGRAWTAATPSGTAGSALYGVSCSSAASCFAVGGKGTGGPVVERWDGRRWRPSAVPVPRGSYLPWLQSVSCVSAVSCLAVGDDFSPGVYAAAWNGFAWRLVAMTAKGDHVAFLQRVRCLSATSCVALGASTQVAATQRSESAFWDGRTWRVVRTA